MASENLAQIEDWNGVIGQRWAEFRRETDGIVTSFGAAALARAAAQPGERVVDIGCGCGDSSLELARQVGSSGSVLGIDVSRPMLEVARARAGAAAGLEFVEADASEAPLPAGVDLLFSRFGVMFFGLPVPAFSHLRSALRPDGRFVFVCWRTPRDNPWAMVPLLAARQALGVTASPADPNAPGPFALADGERVRSLLADAGFVAIEVDRFDAPVMLGATPHGAAETAVRIGPTSRLLREQGIDDPTAVIEAIEAALAPHVAGDAVRLNGSTWIVSARGR